MTIALRVDRTYRRTGEAHIYARRLLVLQHETFNGI